MPLHELTPACGADLVWFAGRTPVRRRTWRCSSTSCSKVPTPTSSPTRAGMCVPPGEHACCCPCALSRVGAMPRIAGCVRGPHGHAAIHLRHLHRRRPRLEAGAAASHAARPGGQVPGRPKEASLPVRDAPTPQQGSIPCCFWCGRGCGCHTGRSGRAWRRRCIHLERGRRQADGGSPFQDVTCHWYDVLAWIFCTPRRCQRCANTCRS